ASGHLLQASLSRLRVLMCGRVDTPEQNTNNIHLTEVVWAQCAKLPEEGVWRVTAKTKTAHTHTHTYTHTHTHTHTNLHPHTHTHTLTHTHTHTHIHIHEYKHNLS